MDVVVVTVFVTMVLGAPDGIMLSLAMAVIAAALRSRGTLQERAQGMLRTGFLWASVAFSVAALVVGDWELVAIVWLIAAFAVNVWREHGAVIDRDRAALIARFMAALAGFAMAWLLANWVTTPAAAWFIAVALLAVGVFGATLRWPALPWFAGTWSRLRTAGWAANLGICTLIAALPFV